MSSCSRMRRREASSSATPPWRESRTRRKLSVSATLVALTLALTGQAAAQTLVAAKPPEARSYARLFRTAADMLESPYDPRLDLSSGNGTIEFWAGRNWQAAGGSNEFYCVVANGEPGTRRSAANVDEPVFEPRYAIYLSQQFLYFQTGEDVYVAPLSLDLNFDFQAEKAHFAVVVRGDQNLVDVFVNGQPGPTIENVRLKGLGVGRVTVGAPTTGKAQSRFGSEKPKTIDLAKVAKPYRGTIADLRIWSKDFDSRIFLSGLEPAPILQRNQDDIERTIAFGGVNEDSTVTRPTYQDLVLYSSFRGDAGKHSLKLQYGIEGHWLNASRQSPRMDSAMETVLGDSLGNVELPWNITIRPATPDRAAWLVYLDSNYTGYIADSGDDDESLVFVPADSKSGPERKFMVDGDSLRMLDTVPSTAFGGFNGASTAQIELVRPTGAWMGQTVDANDPFWKSESVGYTALCYKAYNPLKMPSTKEVHLDRYGRTGSSKFIFKEPARGDFRWNQDAMRVLPNTLAFINIASGSGTEITTTAFTEEEAIIASSMKFGRSISVDCLYTMDVSSNATNTSSSTALDRRETVETNSSLILKSHALVLDMSRAELDPAFVQRVEALRDSTNLDRDYDSFIQEVGTHYTAAVTYGAMAETVYKFAKADVEAALFQGYSLDVMESKGMSAQTTASINIAPLGIGGGGSITSNNKLSKGTNESQDNSFNQNRKESNSKSSRKTYVYGTTTISADGGSLSADKPVPLFFDLRPIYELLSPHFFSDQRILDEVRPRLKARILGALNAPLADVLKTRVVPLTAGASSSPKIAAYKEALRSRLAASEIAGLLVPPVGSLSERLTTWTSAGPYLPPPGAAYIGSIHTYRISGEINTGTLGAQPFEGTFQLDHTGLGGKGAETLAEKAMTNFQLKLFGSQLGPVASPGTAEFVDGRLNRIQVVVAVPSASEGNQTRNVGFSAGFDTEGLPVKVKDIGRWVGCRNTHNSFDGWGHYELQEIVPDEYTAERLLASSFLPQASPGLDWILWSTAGAAADGALDLSGVETDSVAYFRSRLRIRRPLELTLRLAGCPRYARVYVNGSPMPRAKATAPDAALFEVRFEHGWNDLVVEKAVVSSERQPITATLIDDSIWSIACLGELNAAAPERQVEGPMNLLATRRKDGALSVTWNYPLPADAAELDARRFEVQRISPTPLSVFTASPQFVDTEAPASAVYRARVNTPKGWSHWSPFLVVADPPKTSGG